MAADPPTVRVIEGDARELPGVESASVDLVVTSPPYPMLPQWDGLFARLGASDFDGMHRVLDDAWRASQRVLVDGGLLAVNIGDALRRVDGAFRLWPNHARVLESADRLGLTPLPYILWKKPTNKPNAFLGSGFLPPNAYVTLDCEYILLFRKGRLRQYPPKDPGRSASALTRAERDHWFSQVWDDVRGVGQRTTDGRSGAFPRQIPERLIRMFSCRGETVLDPFAGTGTTLWAAERLGRRAIGVEIDPALAKELTRKAGAPPGPPDAGHAGRPPRRRRA
jgi:DNA modification methylase